MRAYIRLTALVGMTLGLIGCQTSGEIASTPFAMADGLIFVGTLGVVKPNLGGFVRHAVQDGDLVSPISSIGGPDPIAVGAVSTALGSVADARDGAPGVQSARAPATPYQTVSAPAVFPIAAVAPAAQQQRNFPALEPRCVSMKGPGPLGFWFVVNGCSTQIIGRFCYVGDEFTPCTSPGGFGPISPGGTEEVSGPKSASGRSATEYRTDSCNYDAWQPVRRHPAVDREPTTAAGRINGVAGVGVTSLAETDGRSASR